MNFDDIYGDFTLIDTPTLMIRKVTKNDAEDMYSYASNNDVTKYVTWDTHKSIADTVEFIQFVLGQYESNKLAPLAIEHKETGRFIGTIDLFSWSQTHKSAEIGYVISPDYWGQGITTEAAKALIEFGFNEMELVRIQAKCFVENHASQRVMEKVGMSYEGTLRKSMFVKGKHQDLKMYAIVK